MRAGCRQLFCSAAAKGAAPSPQRRRRFVLQTPCPELRWGPGPSRAPRPCARSPAAWCSPAARVAHAALPVPLAALRPCTAAPSSPWERSPSRGFRFWPRWVCGAALHGRNQGFPWCSPEAGGPASLSPQSSQAEPCILTLSGLSTSHASSSGPEPALGGRLCAGWARRGHGHPAGCQGRGCLGATRWHRAAGRVRDCFPEAEHPGGCSQRALGTVGDAHTVKAAVGPPMDAAAAGQEKPVPAWLLRGDLTGRARCGDAGKRRRGIPRERGVAGEVRGCRRAEAGDPVGVGPALQESHARMAGSIFIPAPA